jgi:hypothetical protein
MTRVLSRVVIGLSLLCRNLCWPSANDVWYLLALPGSCWQLVVEFAVLDPNTREMEDSKREFLPHCDFPFQVGKRKR